MRKLLAIFVLSGLAWAVSPKTITSSQAFTDVNNNVLANGTIVFKLANSDLIVGGPQIVQGLTYTITLNSSGLIPAATTIWATDQMTSTGNYYIVNIFNSNGLLVRGPENWRISGVSPIDLALETNSNLPDPGLSNPVLQNPVATQTITGQALNIASSAPLTVSSAAAFGSTINETTAGSTATAQVANALIPLVALTLQKAETGSADANVLTFTPPAVTGLYRACFAASVSSASSGVISWTLNWTDASGNAQSAIAQDLFQDGTAAPATSFTTSSAGNYHMCRTLDVNSAAANIVVKWVGGGTTVAKVSATIERLI